MTSDVSRSVLRRVKSTDVFKNLDFFCKEIGYYCNQVMEFG